MHLFGALVAFFFCKLLHAICEIDDDSEPISLGRENITSYMHNASALFLHLQTHILAKHLLDTFTIITIQVGTH